MNYRLKKATAKNLIIKGFLKAFFKKYVSNKPDNYSGNDVEKECDWGMLSL